jgi:hypothetical protein
MKRRRGALFPKGVRERQNLDIRMEIGLPGQYTFNDVSYTLMTGILTQFISDLSCRSN